MSEPAQRRRVAPLHIVDHDQQRRLAGEVRGQPVETLQRERRRVSRILPVFGRFDAEDRKAEPSRTGERALRPSPRSRRQLLDKELADQPPSHLSLDLSGPPGQDLHSGAARQPASRTKDRRLTDPRRPLDDHRGALPHATRGTRTSERLGGDRSLPSLRHLLAPRPECCTRRRDRA